MQYFERDGRYNFVDENNVFVGYSSTSDCCEQFGWFISDSPQGDKPADTEVELPDWSEWRFDPRFFEEKEDPHDNGGIAIFKLVSPSGAFKYLHLFNFHNGYYGHGFEFSIHGEVKKHGYL